VVGFRVRRVGFLFTFAVFLALLVDLVGLLAGLLGFFFGWLKFVSFAPGLCIERLLRFLGALFHSLKASDK